MGKNDEIIPIQGKPQTIIGKEEVRVYMGRGQVENAVVRCTFCKVPTDRVIIHRRTDEKLTEWLPCCDFCFAGLRGLAHNVEGR